MVLLLALALSLGGLLIGLSITRSCISVSGTGFERCENWRVDLTAWLAVAAVGLAGTVFSAALTSSGSRPAQHRIAIVFTLIVLAAVVGRALTR